MLALQEDCFSLATISIILIISNGLKNSAYSCGKWGKNLPGGASPWTPPRFVMSPECSAPGIEQISCVTSYYRCFHMSWARLIPVTLHLLQLSVQLRSFRDHPLVKHRKECLRYEEFLQSTNTMQVGLFWGQHAYQGTNWGLQAWVKFWESAAQRAEQRDGSQSLAPGDMFSTGAVIPHVAFFMYKFEGCCGKKAGAMNNKNVDFFFYYYQVCDKRESNKEFEKRQKTALIQQNTESLLS